MLVTMLCFETSNEHRPIVPAHAVTDPTDPAHMYGDIYGSSH